MLHISKATLLQLLLLLLTQLWPSHAGSSHSDKRGLVYVSTAHSTADEQQWTLPGSSITWYYNYSPYPIATYSSLDFVPMLYSIPAAGDTSFTDQATTLLTAKRITHVLAFNEPDGPTSQGGTALSPSDAAKAYVDILVPLQSRFPALQLGLPAVTGSPRGVTWLSAFNKSCHALLPQTGCPAAFLPLHWYGDFASMATYITQLRALYPLLPLWVTEFADPGVSLADTEAFLNASLERLDALPYVQRYAYFGSFRGEDSNVGANAAMLDKGGGITDVGAWYLGFNATGKGPDSGAARLGLRGDRRWVLAVRSAWILLVAGAPFVLLQ